MLSKKQVELLKDIKAVLTFLIDKPVAGRQLKSLFKEVLISVNAALNILEPKIIDLESEDSIR